MVEKVRRKLAIQRVTQAEPTIECCEEMKSSGQRNAQNSSTSSFRRLLRVTGYLLRFSNNAQKKPRVAGSLTAAELEAAENLWIREVQRNLKLQNCPMQGKTWQCRYTLQRSLSSTTAAPTSPDVAHYPSVPPESYAQWPEGKVGGGSIEILDL